MSLNGKVAIITGASRGIGRAIAVKLATQRASLAINYASNDADAVVAVEAVKSQFTLPTQKAIHIRADTSKISECERLVNETIAAFGKIDILVLNAGILLNQSIDQITEESFCRYIDINVKGPLLLTQKALPHIQDGGRVIFVSSSLTAFSGITPNYTLYVTTKGAIEQLSRKLAKDLGRRGVTVNTVSSGPTATELFFNDKTEHQIRSSKT
ncbi:short chain type dehydrogenase [Thraustotheca clavata]|uniref:Short chain type dehydrogenase n=1 Tax=Thraustotheca clavata TaxID=74557 RepID=A0A1V9YNL8_9STRA|nr:short chain type dehydrogenase [Thraustotheca clavata]